MNECEGGMTDYQFKAYLRLLKCHLEDVKVLIVSNEQDKATRKTDEILDILCESINDLN